MSLPRILAHRISGGDDPRPLRRHPAAIAAAALALTLGAVPLLPDGDADRDAIAPTAETAGAPAAPAAPHAPGWGRLTPAMRAEIERVLAGGRQLDRARGRTAASQAAVRCARFEGQRYCLGFGWTDRPRAELAARLELRTVGGRERTGGLEADGLLARTRGRTPAERTEAERAELTMAARSVGKVWLLRHEVQGVPLPDDFAQRHPEVGVATRARGGFGESYPRRSKILTSKVAQAQNETWWCGPAAMQAIGWSAQGKRKNQSYWARRLGTTSAGTAITDMVRVVNNQTDYDEEEHAGPYVVLDISDFTFKQWYRLMMRHVHDYRAPVVLHPVLLKQYYPYLDDDASGHFQVGRGYDQNPDGNRQIGYFEPWDQSAFDPSEPAIGRVQWRNAYKSYRANLDHFQHNIGV